MPERARLTARVIELDGFLLADDALVQGFFHVQQALAFLAAIRMVGMPVHIATTSAISSALRRGWLVVSFQLDLSAASVSCRLSRCRQAVEFFAERAFFFEQLQIVFHLNQFLFGAAHLSGLWALYMRRRAEASSIRSIALSGRKRSGT